MLMLMAMRICLPKQFFQATATSLVQSEFNINPEAAVYVLAEFAVLKPTEAKVTRLFLILGDLAIQIQGS